MENQSKGRSLAEEKKYRRKSRQEDEKTRGIKERKRIEPLIRLRVRKLWK